MIFTFIDCTTYAIIMVHKKSTSIKLFDYKLLLASLKLIIQNKCSGFYHYRFNARS